MCIEKKLELTGKLSVFSCELLHFEENFGVLKYIIDRSSNVSTVKLYSGDITYALYWTDRPYTLYIWHLQNGLVNYYFNVADSVSLSPEEFFWRDLVVDVLVDSDRKVHVLDEDELPLDISSELSSFIQQTKKMILRDYRQIIQEADRLLKRVIGKNKI